MRIGFEIAPKFESNEILNRYVLVSNPLKVLSHALNFDRWPLPILFLQP